MKLNNARRQLTGGLVAIIFALGIYSAHAGKIVGPWVPMFKGIDHSVSTNEPSNQSDQLQVVHAMRVDLLDPDISLYSTPRIANYVANSKETGGYKVRDFLQNHKLQVAINANFFDPSDYYLPAGTAMDVSGLAISQGVVVSAQEGRSHSASILFRTNNEASIIHTNWPATNTTGIYTAVSGEYPVLVKGINIGSQYRSSSDPIHDLQPRTAFGLSKDRRYLFMITIDGRQGGYSDGAYDDQTAAWLLVFGAYDGVNMDGGGSTTLVVEDTTGVPRELNHSSAVADSGKERTVGSHFGIFAKPPLGFINNVVALPDDTAAVITWSTLSPSSSQVEYGLSTNFTDSSALQSDPVTNHVVLLTGLVPGSDYYYQVVSTYAGVDHTSDTFHFVTTNYLSSNQLFGVESDWKYTTDNLDSINWTATNYDDSLWSGPGNGLLWIDVRTTPPGPDQNVVPKNTQMPADPNNNGFPFSTYYFRKHFNWTNTTPGATLAFSAFVDDGAVFYLNGTEVYRLRMDPAANPISNDMVAISYPCSGDATCPDEFALGPEVAANLVNGDNVLAVEVHNFVINSPDITFGTALFATSPNAADPKITIDYVDGKLALNWTRNAFALQSADTPSGPWVDVPGPVLTGPFTPQMGDQPQFYRLRR